MRKSLHAQPSPGGDPIRVLHIITESNLGGAQRNTLLSVIGLNHPPFQVELVAGPEGYGTPGRLIEESKKAGVSARILAPLVRRIAPMRDLRALLQLFLLMRRNRHAIVHTHSTKAGFLGRLAAFLARVPVVIHTVHGFPFLLRGDLKTRVYFLLERVFSWFSDALITVGHSLEEELVRRKGVSREKVETLYSGIDFRGFDRFRRNNGIRQELGIPPRAPVIGFVGRLSKQKAPENLVSAAGRILERFPGARFLLLGEGPMRKSLEEQIREKSLEEKVLLLGEREDVPRILPEFDVFVLPSRWEGVGRALTEAMYQGLPVVASCVNGVPELVEDGVTGILVPPDEVVLFSQAIVAILEDKVLARQLGRKSREKVKKMMNGETMVKEIERIYRTCLARKGIRRV